MNSSGSGPEGSLLLPEILEELKDFQGLTALEYANRLVSNRQLWSIGHSYNPSDIVDTINEGFSYLIDRSSEEDLEEAKQKFIDYGQDQRDKYNESRQQKYSPNYYENWCFILRRLAAFNIVDRSELSTYMVEGRAVPGVVTFWQDIYKNTVSERTSNIAFVQYVMGPGVEKKDTAILSDVLEQLQNEDMSEVLPLNGIGKPEKLVRITYDCFSALIDEAAVSGWQNASVLQAMLAKMPKRDIPLHSVVNALGNKVTDVLNSNNAQPTPNVQLDKLNLYEISHMAEAINRCLYLIFEFGNDPVGHDSLNYRLSGQILGKFCTEAETRLRD